MKKLILVCVLTTLSLNLIAQANQTEAKAAYMLAEENYSKGDYPSALKFLDMSKKSLGSANSKMLYLEIQIETELYKNDTTHYARLINSIRQFQAAPDIKQFNEEKVLEVVKAKMQIEDQHGKEEQARSARANLEKNFANYGFANWPLLVNYSDLKITHKDSLLFKEEPKNKTDKTTAITLFYQKGIDFSHWTIKNNVPAEYPQTNVFGVLTDSKKVVKGYRKMIFGGLFKKDNATEEKAKFEALAQERTKLFGFPPTGLNTPGEAAFVWEKENKRITLYKSAYFVGKNRLDYGIMEEVMIK